MHIPRRLIALCLALPALSGVGQTDPNAPPVGVQAVRALVPHLVLTPKITVPKTGQPLDTNGHWSMSNQPPAECATVPAGSGPCVRLLYSVPEAEVSCEWVVLLNDGTVDLTFLDENDDAARYFTPKLYLADLKPLVLKKSLPVYPPIAGAAHVQGDVKIKVQVATDGKSAAATVISAPPMFNATALDAARSWRFKPLQIGSRTVPYEAEIVFRFELDPSGSSRSVGSAP